MCLCSHSHLSIHPNKAHLCLTHSTFPWSIKADFSFPSWPSCFHLCDSIVFVKFVPCGIHMGFGILNINLSANTYFSFKVQLQSLKFDWIFSSKKVSFIASRSPFCRVCADRSGCTQVSFDWAEIWLSWAVRGRRKLSERKWADGSTSYWIITYSDKVSACLQMDYTELPWDTTTWLISWLAHKSWLLHTDSM